MRSWTQKMDGWWLQDRRHPYHPATYPGPFTWMWWSRKHISVITFYSIWDDSACPWGFSQTSADARQSVFWWDATQPRMSTALPADCYLQTAWTCRIVNIQSTLMVNCIGKTRMLSRMPDTLAISFSNLKKWINHLHFLDVLPHIFGLKLPRSVNQFLNFIFLALQSCTILHSLLHLLLHYH